MKDSEWFGARALRPENSNEGRSNVAGRSSEGEDFPLSPNAPRVGPLAGRLELLRPDAVGCM